MVTYVSMVLEGECEARFESSGAEPECFILDGVELLDNGFRG